MNQLADEAANQCMDSGCDFADWSHPLPYGDVLAKTKLLFFPTAGSGAKFDWRQLGR